MKPIKMLGLTAMAMLMAIAFTSPTAAIAETTALCTEDPGEGPHEECETKELLTHVHEATLPGHPATLLTGIGNVTCNVLFLGDALEGLVANGPVVIHGNFTYANCLRNGTQACTATEVSVDSLITLLKTGHERGIVEGEGEVNLRCGFLINCTYDGQELIGEAFGPLLSENYIGETRGGTLLDNGVVHKVAGLCPAEAKLDITTSQLEKEPIHITE